MKVIDIIHQRQGRPFASFEIVPPLKGTDAERLYGILEPLMQFQPPFINITCHRDEVEYHPNADGTYTKFTLSKRPSTIAIIAAVMRRFPQVEIVPHVICGGASRHHIENELLDLRFLGIENVMALRGDALPGQREFIPDPDGFAHTNELVAMIDNLNRGIFLDPTLNSPLGSAACNKQELSTLNTQHSTLNIQLSKTHKLINSKTHNSFCIGVAGYPEKHFEAANIETDIENLRRKVENGADYIVTQMFFSNEVFYRFRDACDKAGIRVPIIPGLKPISTLRQVELLPKTFHIDLPQPLVEALTSHQPTPDSQNSKTQKLKNSKTQNSKLKTLNTQNSKLKTLNPSPGTEWCIRQSEDLIAHGVPAIHYYTMGRTENIQQIVKSVF